MVSSYESFKVSMYKACSNLSRLIGSLLVITSYGFAQSKDISEHIFECGYVGHTQAQLQILGQRADVIFSAGFPANGGLRSKGSYSFAGVKAGEVVLRFKQGAVIDEFIDFPLVSAVDLPENIQTAQALASQPTVELDPFSRPTYARNPMGTRRPSAESMGGRLQQNLEIKFGQPLINYFKPPTKNESGRSVQMWRAKSQQGAVSVRLELFFNDDAKFLANRNPHLARVSFSFTPTLESVIFDPGIFLLKNDELTDKLAVLGLNVQTGAPLETKVFDAAASVSVNAKLNRLQGVDIRFKEFLPTTGIVLRKYKDEFLNTANAAITSKLRSYPTELKKTNVSYESKDYLLYDPATGDRYIYTDVLRFSSTEVKLIWSPGRGAANYRLDGYTLQVLPPGIEVTKAIDPSLGTLSAGESQPELSLVGDFNLPTLSFAEFKANVQKGKLGTWIEVPMENQGELPLCLPASMARIMRYYGRQVNQYTVAQVGGTDMRGTDWTGTAKIINACCAKLGFHVRQMDKSEDLGSFIKEQIDNGQPVLWLIPQHARIINGYNLQTKSILYTDSWGAGFEVRSMPYAEAVSLTQQAYAFLPPGAIK